jgi:hypothetical protein
MPHKTLKMITLDPPSPSNLDPPSFDSRIEEEKNVRGGHLHDSDYYDDESAYYDRGRHRGRRQKNKKDMCFYCCCSWIPDSLETLVCTYLFRLDEPSPRR